MSDPRVHSVREDARTSRYIPTLTIEAYMKAIIIEGTKSISNGTPPIGAGNVYGA